MNSETAAWNPSEPGSIERLQVVYKIAERCNLNCSYCYYYNLGDDTPLRKPARAPLSSATDLARGLAQGCSELGIREVRISFHGGEPMLLRAREFARICDSLLRTIGPHADVRFSIQTNGTLMTDGWLEALRLYGVSVGVSIDGGRAEHDKFRLDHRGQSSFDATEATIKRLVAESARCAHLSPGTISVLGAGNDYGLIYRYLRGLGVRSMHFLLPDRSADDKSPEVHTEVAAIGRSLLDIFEAWMTEDDPDISVRFIGETLEYFQIGGPRGPVPRRRKTNQILVAHSDGTIAIDDSMMPALDWYARVPKFPIDLVTLRDVFRDPVFQLLEAEKNRLPDACGGCSWVQLCRGGDLENRYSKAGGFNNPSVYCAAYKTLYRGICDLLVNNGYPEPEIAQRFGALQDA